MSVLAKDYKPAVGPSEDGELEPERDYDLRHELVRGREGVSRQVRLRPSFVG